MGDRRTYGDGAYGLPLMKFTLTYDGALPPSANGNGNLARKWAIRRDLHPQLQQLWSVHPALKRLDREAVVPKTGGFWNTTPHHLDQTEYPRPPLTDDVIDLCEPIERGGRRFLPLVRNSFALTCGLKILFLRQEAAGRVYRGGDLDNRIKTLLDALSVPPHPEHVLPDPDLQDPICCLVEDDALVTGLTIETERLLGRPGAKETEVRLIIEVDVRVTDSRTYNTVFLGD